MRTEISQVNLGEYISRRIGVGTSKTLYLKETGEKILIVKIEE